MATVIASLMALIGADTKGFETGVKRVKGELSTLGSSISKTVSDNKAQFVSLAAGLTWVAVSAADAVKSQIEYANQVRQLSSLSGASAEDSSRLIQVLDDYKISADDALVATKALTAQGYTPSIETLAKLSDQYLSLSSTQAKNEFVLKNLGKGGLKWVEVLNKGSKAIKEQGAGISDSLILTQRMVDDARKAEIAMDQWNDSVLALKTSFATQLLPALTDVLNEENDLIRARQMAKEDGVNVWLTTEKQAQEYIGLAKAEREAATAAMMASKDQQNYNGAVVDSKEAIQGAKDSLREYEDALDAVSQANQDMESMSRTIAEDQKQYTQDHADAIRDLGAAQVDLKDAQKIGDEGKIADATAALKKQEGAVKELEASWHESANNMIYDMILVGVSAGGLLDSEQKAIDEYAVKTGIKTQADIDEANRRREVADATIEGILQSEDVLTEQRKVDAETLRLQDAVTSAESITASNNEAAAIAQVSLYTQRETDNQALLAAKAKITASAYATIKYPSMSTGTPYKAPTGTTGGKSPDEREHATGGDFLIPMSYGNEGFRMGNGDTASGGETISITPKGKNGGGVTYNIVVNNPKREVAEESIRSAMKKIAYTGAAA